MALQESERPLTNLATPDFVTIKETSTFVDKTLFIKSFLSDSSKVVFLTAPRAFGKSTLMNMMKQFLLGKTNLFKDLKISTDENNFFLKHCIPHPVIHIDLSLVCGTNFAEVKRNLALAVNEAFGEHEYLVKRTDDGVLVWASEKLRNDVQSDLETFKKYFEFNKCKELSVPDLESSLRFLSQVLHTHYGENVFILIDEYDSAAVSMVSTTRWNEVEIALIDNLLRGFMADTLKANSFVEHSLIIGIARLAGAYSGDAAKIIKHHPFLCTPRYAPYLGFTEEEVEELLQRPEVKNICGDPETIRRWYGGYIVSGDSTLKIYNSWSVLNYLQICKKAKKPEFSSYWIGTGHVQNIDSLFAEPSIRKKIEQIIAHDSGIKRRMVKSVTLQNIKSLNELISLQFDELSEETVDLFLQFLADNGYINIIHEDDKLKQQAVEEKDSETETAYEEEITEEGSLCILKVPNFEIRDYLEENCYSEVYFVTSKHNLKSSDIKTYVNALISVLEDTSEEAFVDLAKAVVALFSASDIFVDLANPLLVQFSGSEIIISCENEFQKVLFTLAYNSRYFVPHSEIQIRKNTKGLGIAPTFDMAITMKKNGIIFEIKVGSKSAEEGLKQIFEKCHYTKFEEPGYEHISKKIYASLVFNTKKKKVFITYKVGNEGESKSVGSDDKS